VEATLLEFKKATPSPDVEPTKATAHLPGLEIEITHRRSPDGDAEQISINMQAVPSFEAFGRYVEATNPFAFWAQAVQLAWSPWIEAARNATLPRGAAPALTKSQSEADSRSPAKSRSSG
jgi:hypothetical protein